MLGVFQKIKVYLYKLNIFKTIYIYSLRERDRDRKRKKEREGERERVL